MQPESNGIKTWQWVVTAIIIIVLIIIGVLVFNNKSTETPGAMTETPTTTETPAASVVNRIIMSDQYPGNVVYLSSVQLAKPGWVVIHKDAAGKPGAIIGSVYLPAGTNPGKVTLTSPMVDGQLYYAMLHNDDGDMKFDATKDMPLMDASGTAIMKPFRASVAAGNDIKG